MALTAGTRLGLYEITAQIGSGGMGEVYRARDTKLDRDVAIKVLPDDVAANPDRLARFEREAKTLAALNHPNIAIIHGFEEVHGIQALVMELVEGPTLADRIAQGPLPLDQALPIAHQIAEALEAAHERGVVHRDLKPANIKLTPADDVKVLDFGLAKSVQQPTPVSPDGPTLATPGGVTDIGLVVGTAAYMSPEQSRGWPVDSRTDIWAFGCVLFEMLTGQRPFAAANVSDTIAALLRSEPEWTALPATTPRSVKKVLRRCLEKDPRQRLRHIGDAVFDLDEAFEHAAQETARDARPWSRHRAVMLVMALSALALGVTASSIWQRWRVPQESVRSALRLDVDLGGDVSLSPPAANANRVVISPDGGRLVYISSVDGISNLFTRRLDQLAATRLPSPEGAAAHSPFFSPDGTWIGFFAGNRLYRMSMDGGAPSPIADARNVVGASWSEDGSIVYGQAFVSGLLRIAPEGGVPSPLTKLEGGELVHGFPQVLPGGKAVLFSSYSTAIDLAHASVEIVTIADGRRRTLKRGATSGRYLESGHLMYAIQDTLFAIPFDLDTLETYGSAAAVVEQVAHQPLTNIAQFDASRNGTFVYRRSSSDHEIPNTIHWMDASGRTTPLLTKPSLYFSPRLSPDSKRLLLIVEAGTQQDAWVYETDRDTMTRLTFGGVMYSSPSWSPDGRYVVFGLRGQGIFWTRSDGGGQPQALTKSGGTIQLPASFSADGKWLAYTQGTGTGPAGTHIWIVPIAEEGGQLRAGSPEAFHHTQFAEDKPAFSPDGRWLAYESTESGRSEIDVRPFHRGGSRGDGKWRVSSEGGSDPVWSHDGRDLLYRNGDRIMAVRYTTDGDSFVAEKARVWLAKLDGAGASGWDLSRDGTRLAVTTTERTQTPRRDHTVVLITDFFDDLLRRVPLTR